MSEYTSERLARALGWIECSDNFEREVGYWWTPDGSRVTLPNYYDLNELSIVEVSLDDNQRRCYTDTVNRALRELIGGYTSGRNLCTFDFITAPATVRLRALIEMLEVKE